MAVNGSGDAYLFTRSCQPYDFVPKPVGQLEVTDLTVDDGRAGQPLPFFVKVVVRPPIPSAGVDPAPHERALAGAPEPPAALHIADETQYKPEDGIVEDDGKGQTPKAWTVSHVPAGGVSQRPPSPGRARRSSIPSSTAAAQPARDVSAVPIAANGLRVIVVGPRNPSDPNSYAPRTATRSIQQIAANTPPPANASFVPIGRASPASVGTASIASGSSIGSSASTPSPNVVAVAHRSQGCCSAILSCLVCFFTCRWCC